MDWLTNWLAGRRLAAVIAAALAIYALMLTVTIPALTRSSGGLPIFDMMPTGYDAGYALALLNALGPEGRSIYLTRQLPLDAFYPGLGALALAGLWLWALRRIGATARAWRLLALLPFAMALLDYGENVAILAMLLNFPRLAPEVIAVASVLTMTKSAVAVVCFTGVLLIIARALLRPAARG